MDETGYIIGYSDGEIEEQNKREYGVERAHGKYTCPFCGGNNTDLASKKNARVRFICHYCLKSFGDYGHGFVID